MTKSDTNLSPSIKGESKKKNLVEELKQDENDVEKQLIAVNPETKEKITVKQVQDLILSFTGIKYEFVLRKDTSFLGEKIGEDIELIEFNVKTPKVFYDFFSAVIKLLDWKYNHVIDYFEDVLVNSLVSQMYCDKSLVLPDNLLKKFDNISESFINEKKGEKK